MYFRNILLALSIVIFTNGCSDEPSNSRALHRPSLDKERPAIRLKLNNDGTIYYGDTIIIDVEALKSENVLINATAAITDLHRVVASAKDGHLVIPTVKTGGGDFQLKIEASFENGKVGMRYKAIQVVAREKPENWHFEVINRYPHDSHSYTQGLFVLDGYIYEGSGTYGGSHLRKLDLKTGKVLRESVLPDAYFGEGIAHFDDKIYQLTYKASKGFIYDLNTFDKKGEFTYDFNTSEGWGLTSHDSSLIASDGSEMLYFIHPQDFSITGYLRVFNQNGSVNRLNELEYYNGKIYANIYTTARIVAIDPISGRVTDTYTASGIMLQSEATPNMDVLNGIAFNPLNGNFLITGKNWSTLYEVRPIPSDI